MAQQLTKTVDTLLQKKQDRHIKSLLLKEEPPTIAETLEQLEKGAVKTFGLLPPEVQAEVALSLSDAGREKIISRLSDFTIARFLYFIDENDAADIVQIFPDERKLSVLDKLKDGKRKKIEKLLTYHPESAGGLMDLNFLTVSETDTIPDVTRKAQEAIGHKLQSPTIVVVNPDEKPTGFIPYKSLISRRHTEIAGSIKLPLPLINAEADQEHVLHFLLEERSDVAGVTDGNGHIAGILRVADLLRVVQAEATEDLFAFAGVSREEEIFDPVPLVVKRRSMWLIINLATAFLASFVVSRFENTIAQMAILASFMPIVAGMGGNAGTQALAVVVRALAMGELSLNQARRAIMKEVAAGFLNGLLVALFAVPGVYFISGNIGIALVLGTAMIINLVVAGLFGALIPLTLKFFKVDPAVASSVFVTTATDIFGFLTFLGLATVFLLK